MQVAEILGRQRVVFVEDGIVAFSPIRDRGKNPIGNLGSLESALVDIALLSHCDDIITTFASSFGHVAAAWGGIAPVRLAPELFLHLWLCQKQKSTALVTLLQSGGIVNTIGVSFC